MELRARMLAVTTSESDGRARLRALPKVDLLVREPALGAYRKRHGDATVVRVVRVVVAALRAEVLSGGVVPELADVVARVAADLDALAAARLRRVINGTGVVLHTNLGRAPLSHAAVSAVADAARGYVSLEIDLATGGRGARAGNAERSLAELCGAESALVVNNNAAAVLLALTALAAGRPVLVSRGELVEIGGGFRVPEVLERSGARMIEVGTTNRTRLADYARALDEHPDAAAILSVHPGNFRITGFTERPLLEDLAALATERGIWLIDDLGGGALVDLDDLAGLEGEPVASARVASGAHVVCFSCDKVLGGPQGGAIVGAEAALTKIRRDPLARALRLGPLPAAALEATLGHYLSGDLDEIPALAMLRRPLSEVRARAEGWMERLRARGLVASIVDHEGRVGGGTFAEEPVPSVALALVVDGVSADQLARRLRVGAIPVLARTVDDRVLIDARTVLPEEDDRLLEALLAVTLGTS